jgi:lysophospholipid acyltransferase (LPLAT)-like uncharacterized protein
MASEVNESELAGKTVLRTASRPALAWRRWRTRLRHSSAGKSAIVWLLVNALRLVHRTNPPLPVTHDAVTLYRRNAPSITALWHGQHFMVPFFRPRDLPAVALFSRSADAELNAEVAIGLDVEVVRGSGGREGARHLDKGGSRALLTLKRALGAGKTVVMIADIPHGTPRQAGLGIVTLARISGRPMLPTAYASSRRKVLEKTWDKTTLNLPFGRSVVICGDPIFVPADADAVMLEEKRAELTAALNDVTARAYALVDKRA